MMMHRLKHKSVLLWLLCNSCCEAWTTAPTMTTRSITRKGPEMLLRLAKDTPDDLTELPDFNEDDNEDDSQPKLGIDISSYMDPLSSKEAAELKAAATEIINDAVASGLDDIEHLRRTMKQAVDKKRAEAAMQSELRAQRESKRLLNKIDQLTSDFLSKSAASRTATKLAAAADQAAAGRGVEHGSWGNIGRASVNTMLGSVEERGAAAADVSEQQQQPKNRIVMLADESSADPCAQRLVPALTEKLQKLLSSSGTNDDNNQLEVVVYKPTATVPLGGNNAAAVVLFCTSYTDKSSVTAALDRLLRRTMDSTQPPTQIVVVSTIGTERTNKMPFSMQNLISGGKLEKRRQMEEAVIRIVKNRVVTPPLDYTICKLGELKETCSDEFEFEPGDSTINGNSCLSVETAVTVLSQAIALQPAARNATFSCAGNLAFQQGEEDQLQQQKILDDAFLRLDGPELLRIDLSEHSTKDFDQLTEYVREWAFLLAESGKGLTTPIRVEDEVVIRPQQAAMAYAAGVDRVTAIDLLFLPTATGKNYMSRREEEQIQREREGVSSSASRPVARRSANQKTAKEGGIEFLVEITDADRLRVRAKRCNYGDDAIVKELSEETILSRFQKSIEVWKNDHRQMD